MIPRKRKDRGTKVKAKAAKIPYSHVVEVVANGALATGATAGGLHVPVVILDTSRRSDIHDVFTAHSHEHLNNGDIEAAWVGAKNNSWIGLDIRFKRPVETRAIIRFRMPEYALVVTQALRSKALYIHTGKIGVKFSDYYLPSEKSGEIVSDSTSIMVQLSHGGFERKWKEINSSIFVKYFMNEGFAKGEATRMADEAMFETKRFTDFRLPRNSPELGNTLYIKTAGPEDA